MQIGPLHKHAWILFRFNERFKQYINLIFVFLNRFQSWLGSFCTEFACSPCPCTDFYRVLQLPPTVQTLINAWSCNGLVIHPECFLPSATGICDKLQNPCDPKTDSGGFEEWAKNHKKHTLLSNLVMFSSKILYVMC